VDVERIEVCKSMIVEGEAGEVESKMCDQKV